MKILNVGCGDDTYGTDFVDMYPSRPDVKKVDLDKQKLPYKANEFDEVYSKCLFEHVRNPGAVLQEMVRVLKSWRQANNSYRQRQLHPIFFVEI